jgi:hypothetical protein
MNTAKERIKVAQSRQKKHADRSRRAVVFAVGDKVLLSTDKYYLPGLGSRKLAPRFCGPFKITKLCGPNAVQLDLPKRTDGKKSIHDVINVSRIKPYVDGNEQYPGREVFMPPPITVDGEELFIVQAFLDERIGGPTSKTQPHILVRWKGCAAELDTWEPVNQLKKDLKSEFPNFLKMLRASRAPAREPPKEAAPKQPAPKKAAPPASMTAQQQAPVRRSTRNTSLRR